MTLSIVTFEARRPMRVAALVVGPVLVLALLVLLSAEPAYAKTFTVNYRGDATDDVPGDGSCNAGFGLCSLRAAIQEANEFAGADVVPFDIQDTGVQTIEPKTELPEITDRVTIDGYTQPGAKMNTIEKGTTNATLRVEISGENVETNATTLSVTGLRVDAPRSVVKGLVINRFFGDGIVLGYHGSASSIVGNFIGTDPSAPSIGATV